MRPKQPPAGKGRGASGEKGRRAGASRTSDPAVRARRVLAALRREYPGATTELEHGSALELLVATILSAQSTDATVNKVMPRLMKRYPDAGALARARPQSVEELVHSTGFFRQKTKSIQGACRRLVEAYGGEVPASMEDLLTLPGVARKTANVVLSSWFHKNEGIAVDTHVGRVACRLGVCAPDRNPKDASRIEQDLMRVLPRRSWGEFSNVVILHGRRVCTARKPGCERCVLARECPSAQGPGTGAG